MSTESLERVYTINLGKVLLSPKNQRAKRAINMIREFATKHMKSENVKIEEEVSHLVWTRGIRHPPRKIRVKITKDDGNIIVSKYQEEKSTEETSKKGEKKSEAKPKKGEKKVEAKKAEEKPKKTETKVEEKPTKEEKKVEEKKAEEKPKKTETKTTGQKTEKKSKKE